MDSSDLDPGKAQLSHSLLVGKNAQILQRPRPVLPRRTRGLCTRGRILREQLAFRFIQAAARYHWAAPTNRRLSKFDAMGARYRVGQTAIGYRQRFLRRNDANSFRMHAVSSSFYLIQYVIVSRARPGERSCFA